MNIFLFATPEHKLFICCVHQFYFSLPMIQQFKKYSTFFLFGLLSTLSLLVQAQPTGGGTTTTLTKTTTVAAPKIDKNKIAADNANRTKSVGWIKSSINSTNNALAKTTQIGKGTSETDPFQKNMVLATQKLLNQGPLDLELDNANKNTGHFALMPSNILDFVEINKKLADKTNPRRSIDRNVMLSFFKKRKAKLTQSWSSYLDISTGYLYNASSLLESIQRLSDTPLSVNFNNVTSSMVPITLGYFILSPLKRYAVGINASYYFTNNVTFIKSFADTLTKNAQLYISAAAIKPNLNLLKIGLDMSYYFHQILTSGKDLFKVYASLGLDAYYLNYADRVRITTSNIIIPRPIIEEEKTYLQQPENFYQDFDRIFELTFIFGGKMSFGVYGRITPNFGAFCEMNYSFILPVKEEIKATSVVNIKQTNVSGIPWVSLPNKIRLGYGHLLGINAGLRFVF